MSQQFPSFRCKFIFLEEGLHCVRLETSDERKEMEDDDLHTIDVLVRYNGGNASIFTWQGTKNIGNIKEICQPLKKNTTGLVYAKDIWIRQRGSNNTWFAKSIFLQENIEAPYFARYALNPSNQAFWTDR